MWMLVATPPFTDVERFDAVTALAGEGEGMRARYCGVADGVLRVITVCESREHAERFLAERLGPAFARVLGPEPGGRPEVLGLEVARSWVAEPVG
jgi:hypothetical protein